MSSNPVSFVCREGLHERCGYEECECKCHWPDDEDDIEPEEVLPEHEYPNYKDAGVK